jgi:DNA-binding beta-propeller fold protein YncE
VRAAALSLLCAAAALAGCGDDPPRSGTAIDLPGAQDGVDLDDLSYSRRLHALLVPAREAGLMLVERDGARVRRIGGMSSADSADEGGGLVYVTNRKTRSLVVVDPIKGRVVASVPTRGRPDYVRYVGGARELWVTVPGSGIQIFRAASAAAAAAAAPTAIDFVAITPAMGGPEGIAISRRRNRAFVHLRRGQVAAIDLERRQITDTWQLGCDATHGFPRVDERRGLLLAGCGSDGEVVLLDIDDGGRRLGSFQAGGGEAILAHSAATGHFFARGDPGDAVVTLAARRSGLREVRRDRVASDGHCLGTDERGHVWVCDPAAAAVVRLADRPG